MAKPDAAAVAKRSSGDVYRCRARGDVFDEDLNGDFNLM